MEFFLPMTPETAVEFFRNRLMQHPMSSCVNLLLSGHKLKVTIQKIGTSKLTFNVKTTQEGCTFSKVSESISLVHRSHIPQIFKAVSDVVKEQGGWVR